MTLMHSRRAALSSLVALPLAGCWAGPYSSHEGAALAARTNDAPVLHVITSRRLAGSGAQPPYFDWRRAAELTYAEARYARPDRSVLGRIGSVVSGDFGMSEVSPFAGEALDRLAEVLSSRDSLLFVHGYNQTFEAAARDAARLGDDIGFDGRTILFTWPSKGGLFDYGYDRESAMLARDHLADTLHALLGEGRSGRVHLVAHSMGTLATLEALRGYRDRHGEAGLERLGTIVLAAPDIDFDVFKAGLSRLGPLRQKLTVITATNDRALDLSRRLAGGDRVGALSGEQLVGLGVRIVDATDFASGLTRHDAFISNDDVRSVIRRAIERS
ncbi:MAG TPA: alpha/beta fold hydrolase [Beijerinckiaceae bacterium]|nr:alpha/beta fold hydrolase [Beijerinckiaceae bacterium]